MHMRAHAQVTGGSTPGSTPAGSRTSGGTAAGGLHADTAFRIVASEQPHLLDKREGKPLARLDLCTQRGLLVGGRHAKPYVSKVGLPDLTIVVPCAVITPNSSLTGDGHRLAPLGQLVLWARELLNNRRGALRRSLDVLSHDGAWWFAGGSRFGGHRGSYVAQIQGNRLENHTLFLVRRGAASDMAGRHGHHADLPMDPWILALVCVQPAHSGHSRCSVRCAEVSTSVLVKVLQQRRRQAAA